MMDSSTDVYLNGVELYEGIDYRWTSEGKLVLRRPEPQLVFPSFIDNVVRFLSFRWPEIGNPICFYPDFVAIENWEYGERSTYTFGSEEFNQLISYESLPYMRKV